MPRQAAAAAGFAASTARPLLKPPPDLNALEREAFLDIVLGAPPPCFYAQRSAVGCRLCQGHRSRADRSRRIGRRLCCRWQTLPWLPVWQASIRARTTLARMLALSPGGRVPSKVTRGAGASHLLFSTRSGMKPDEAIDRDALELALEACGAESPAVPSISMACSLTRPWEIVAQFPLIAQRVARWI